jgi:tetratricopeptide (TPR) repeat protein
MGDHHAWMLAVPAALFFDVGSYGVKEWLAILGSLVGIGGSIFGVWRAWRYSKKQIAERLLEFLRDEEAKIVEGRNRVIRHLRVRETLGDEPDHAFYRDLRGTLEELARGDVRDAEKKLDAVADAWAHDVKVGQKFLSNTNLQLATALLIRGKIANGRSEPTAARTAWENALQAYPYDCEAARYLGELALTADDIDGALEYFSKAHALAPDDKMLSAETWQLVADFYLRQGPKKSELRALNECAPDFASAGACDQAAAAYARAGEIAGDFGQTVQAPRLLRQAFDNYSLAGDRDGMRAVRQKLESLGDDVSDLPSVEQPPRRRVPWLWIRLALELSILAAAASLFYLSLR